MSHLRTPRADIVPSNIIDRDIITVGYQLPKIYVDGYSDSSTVGNIECFGTYNGEYVTWFGAFGENINVQIQSLPKSYGNNIYTPFAFSVGGIPYILYPEDISSGSDRDDQHIYYSSKKVSKTDNGFKIIDIIPKSGKKSFEVGYGETIVSVVDTAYPSIKLINTSFGWIYRYDAENGEYSLSNTFDNEFSYEELDSFPDFNTVLSQTKNHIMISYWSNEKNINGVLRTRKNVPDSAAEKVYFVDSYGRDVKIGIITKFLSIGDIVLAEELGGYRIFRSIDDGNKFVLLDRNDDTIELIGCGTNRFYARYGNGEKVYSYDGITWKNAENINASNWNVFNASGVDYISCSKYDEDLKNGILEKNKFILIKEQLKFNHDGTIFEKMCVNKNGDIVCISGMNGSKLIIGRVFKNGEKYGNIEYIDYPYVIGMMFSDAHVVNEDIVLSPYGGMTALKIVEAFKQDSNTEIKFIDISLSLNNEINVFGGFGEANGRVLMYPSDGNSILVYDNDNSNFNRIYSFDSVMTLSDCDSIEFGKSSNAILSPRSSSINGQIKFSITKFDDRLDYGIIEIDEGFPILVTYVKLNTYFDASPTHGDVYKIVFNFINDQNGRAVSILSKPINIEFSTENNSYLSMLNTYSEGIYVVNGKSIKYGFRSFDDTQKFKIEKIFSKSSQNKKNSNGLVIDIIAPSEIERKNIGVAYCLDGEAGGLSVYGNITSENNDYKMELD